jgi:hypothetical protein
MTTAWQEVEIVGRAEDRSIPPFKSIGFVPFPESPLAVSTVKVWDDLDRHWQDEPDLWQIVHRPTGFNLAGRKWTTREEAEAVLLRCDPTYAAWALACGGKEAATTACRLMFKKAEMV